MRVEWQIKWQFKSSLGILGLVGTSAWAIIGSPVNSVLPMDAPSVCQITINQYNVENLCTGTLISPTRIMTAGHCFGRQFVLDYRAVNARCGGIDVGSIKSVKIPDTNNDNLWVNDTQPTHPEDIATIELSRPALTAPSDYAKSESDYFGTNTRSDIGVRCKIMGFGIDNWGVTGNLHEADVTNLAINFVATDRGQLQGGVIYIAPNGAPFLPISADHGDSGGPLFCSRDNGSFKLVAVMGGFTFARNQRKRAWNFMNPIWLHVQ